MNRAIGAGLLIAGILLVIFGMREADSATGQIAEFFTGTPPDRALWMMIGGAFAAVAGVVLLFLPGRRHT